MTDQPEPVDDGVCYIQSTVDAQGRAACAITWGPIAALLTTKVVLATAHDLMAAATAAESDIALIEAFRMDFKVSDEALAVTLSAVRKRRALSSGTVRPALRIAAVAGVRTGLPLVHIARGSQKGELSPDQARDMAMAWTETATAAAIDVRLRYALGEWDHLSPADIERLFTLIRQVQR